MEKNKNKIDFEPIELRHRELYERYLLNEELRGCEFSFTNLYAWGDQRIARFGDNLLLLSKFGEKYIYPFPLGNDDIKKSIDAIILDAKERGIHCRISSITREQKELIEAYYPGKFKIFYDLAYSDYIYDINDLADLAGKKYDGKRNHINRFTFANPDYTAEPITRENLHLARELAEGWYAARMLDDPTADFSCEKEALEKALSSFDELGLEGLVLISCGEPLAFTLASHPRPEIFDVHFEKAKANVQGAYAAINREFAKYIRSKYPNVKFLNREEDMGLEGLRRAKESYHPCARAEKYKADLLEVQGEN